MGDISLEDLADAAAELVIGQLDPKYHLVYVEYDDGLMDEQIQKLFEGHEEDIPDYDWESDNRWRGVSMILDGLLDKDARAFLEDYEAFNRICEAIQERDESDPIGDLMRNTHHKLMRYQLNGDADGAPWQMDDEAFDASARMLGESAGVDWDTNADALRELVAHASSGGGLYFLWRGDIEPVYKAVCAVRYNQPTPTVMVEWTDPELLVLDRLNGSGHAVRVKGTVRLPFDPDRLTLDARRIGFGYSWTETTGGYHPPNDEPMFIYPPAPAVEPKRPMLELTQYGEPYTYAGTPPEDLVGRLVHARPFYQVPTSRGALGPARSPWVRAAFVEDTNGDDMVRVTYYPDERGPWRDTFTFYPRELHRDDCGCAACVGGGINKERGA